MEQKNKKSGVKTTISPTKKIAYYKWCKKRGFIIEGYLKE